MTVLFNMDYTDNSTIKTSSHDCAIIFLKESFIEFSKKYPEKIKEPKDITMPLVPTLFIIPDQPQLFLVSDFQTVCLPHGHLLLLHLMRSYLIMLDGYCPEFSEQQSE